jgi:hypothetical protein
MSVRAYRVLHLDTDEQPTFNLWRDHEVMALLNLSDQLNGDEGGLIHIFQDEVEAALAEARGEETKAILTAMLAHAQAEGGCVEYYCV